MQYYIMNAFYMCRFLIILSAVKKSFQIFYSVLKLENM